MVWKLEYFISLFKTLLVYQFDEWQARLLIKIFVFFEDKVVKVFNRSDKHSPIFVDFFFFICHIYPSLTRKGIVLLYFGREVRTRLWFAFFEVYGPPVFHIKVGIPQSALPKDTTSELAGLFSTTSPKCRAPSGEAVNTIF